MQRKDKKIGTFFTVLMCLVLVCCLAVSWYLGGQKRVIEQLTSGIAHGSAEDYAKSTGTALQDKDLFKEQQRTVFTGMSEFSGLKENDMIGFNVKIQARTPESLTLWHVYVKTDYFCDEMSISKETDYTLEFRDGKWTVTNGIALVHTA